MSSGGFTSYNLPSSSSFSLSYEKSKTLTITGSGAIFILRDDSQSSINLTSVTIDGKTTFSNPGIGALIYFTTKADVKFYNYNSSTTAIASNYFGYYLY